MSGQENQFEDYISMHGGIFSPSKKLFVIAATRVWWGTFRKFYVCSNILFLSYRSFHIHNYRLHFTILMAVHNYLAWGRGDIFTYFAAWQTMRQRMERFFLFALGTNFSVMWTKIPHYLHQKMEYNMPSENCRHYVSAWMITVIKMSLFDWTFDPHSD